jgi:two-component system, NtrC family, response regulator HydG
MVASMAAPRIWIVDDALALAETLADGLSDRGYATRATSDSRTVLTALRAGEIDLLVTDLRMPEVDGLALLDGARACEPDVPVIVMTAYGAIDSAVESIRKGAFHYLTKPFKLDELVVFVERALADRALRGEAARLRSALGELAVRGLVGRSAEMQRVLALIARVAPTDVAVLITGETGTGKSAIARALHAESKRAAGPFVAINCAAVAEQLLASELFGHVKGAFTGATADRAGVFVEAHGGTLLLDEIGEMSPRLQAALLSVLETHRVRVVGGSGEREVDVRVAAATHRDLRSLIEQGRFREDLLYRLELVTVDLPPLRARREDIPPLVDHFLAQARGRHPGSPARGFSRTALARLCDYAWPGNVRELAHTVERAVVLASAAEIEPDDLATQLREPRSDAAEFRDLVTMRELQRRYAKWTYERLGGNKAKAAEALAIDVKTLGKLLAEDD